MPERNSADYHIDATETLAGMDSVARYSDEGGDTDNGQHYTDFRVWPAQGMTKDDLGEAIEMHSGTDAVSFSVSMTDADRDYIYVTARSRP